MTLNIHQKIILAFVLTNFVLFMYDGIFHLTIEIFHGLFESVEHLLDLLVEEVIELSTEVAPETHETQVIVFYILFFFIAFGSYRLYRTLPRWYFNFKQTLQRQKAEALEQWRALPLIQRFEWWAFFITFITGYIFFGF